MKLEVGKCYRTRDGRKVGPMASTGRKTYAFGFECRTWRADGACVGGLVSDHDLIAEWQDEPQASPPTTRAHILDTAKQAVTKDRQATHGKPEDTFGLISAYWSAHLDTAVTAADVAAMMALLKLARTKANPGHMDSWIDIAGYAACAGELADG